jgi:hypothetical protein
LTISFGIVLLFSVNTFGVSFNIVLVEISTRVWMVEDFVRCLWDKSFGSGIYGFGNKDRVDNLFRRNNSAGICFYIHVYKIRNC